MPRRNPWDGVLDTIERSMRASGGYLDRLSEGVEPFDSRALSAEEELLVYRNPAAFYPDATDEQTGLPPTNARAAEWLLDDMGPVEYVAWVERMEARLAREQAVEVADEPATDDGWDEDDDGWDEDEDAEALPSD